MSVTVIACSIVGGLVGAALWFGMNREERESERLRPRPVMSRRLRELAAAIRGALGDDDEGAAAWAAELEAMAADLEPKPRSSPPLGGR